MLGELVDAGKVRWLGSSTFAAWMVMEELAIARERSLPAFVSEQPPYNLLDRRIENELLPVCERYGLAVLPWSPIGGGVLSGRYDSVDRFPEGSRGARIPQTRDRVTEAGISVTAPIVGPRTIAQLDDALDVLHRRLDDDARVACDALVHPGNAVVDFHNSAGWMRSTVA